MSTIGLSGSYQRRGSNNYDVHKAPVSASQTVIQGVLYSLDSDGNARAIDDRAGDRPFGVGASLKSNADGASGDVDGLFATGQHALSGSGFTKYDVGGTCWVHVDSTTLKTVVSANTGSNSIPAGKVISVDNTKDPAVIVDVGEKGIFDLDKSA